MALNILYFIFPLQAVSKGKPIQTLKLWLGGQIPTNVGSNFVLQIIKDNGVTSDVEMVKQDWILHSRLLMLQFYAKEDVNLASRIKLQFRSDNENEVSLLLIIAKLSTYENGLLSDTKSFKLLFSLLISNKDGT